MSTVRSWRLIVLVLAGALLALLSVITLQYMVALVILVIIVSILLLKDGKTWIESLVERLAEGRQHNPADLARVEESLTSLRSDITRIEQRLVILERERNR